MRFLFAAIGLFAALLSSSGMAAPSDLSDVPLVVKNRAKPNVLVMLDNSDPMGFTYLPDSYTESYSYLSSAYEWSGANTLYYNPNTTYTAPVTPVTDSSGNVIYDTNGNVTYTTLSVPSWPNACVDGYAQSCRACAANAGNCSGNSNIRNLSNAFQIWETYESLYYGAPTPDSGKMYCYLNSTNSIGQATNCSAFYFTGASAGNLAVQSIGNSERNNFIIWHSFYRTRMLLLKTLLGRSFSGLDSRYRIGLMTFFSGDNTQTMGTMGLSPNSAYTWDQSYQDANSYFIPVSDFAFSQLANWYTQLYKTQAVVLGPTANNDLQNPQENLHNAYRYLVGTKAFSTQAGGTAGIRTSPALYSCQPNMVVFSAGGTLKSLSTASAGKIVDDGSGKPKWSVSGTPGDVDGALKIPAAVGANFYDPIANATLNSGSNWPRPFNAEPSGSAATATACKKTTSPYVPPATCAVYFGGNTRSPNMALAFNTMADLAAYYWGMDLFTEFNNNKAIVGVSANLTETGNVTIPSGATDRATWPHVATTVLNVGMKGTLLYPNALTSIKAGSANSTSPCTSATCPANWPNPQADDTSVDDMWHAAVNGHGLYQVANDPTGLQNALGSIYQTILALSGSASAVAVANTQVRSGTTNYAYQSSYNSGNWYGDVKAYVIDPTNGVIATTPAWSAQTRLQALTTPASTRKIFTDMDGTGEAFQQSTFGSSAGLLGMPSGSTQTDITNLISFLRGNSTKEYDAGSNPSGIYRNRNYTDTDGSTKKGLLGDTVDAEAVVINNTVVTTGDYSGNNIGQRSKTLLFQGANDGMLHALDGSTGDELYAYVPSLAWSNLYGLSAKTGFVHKFLVDATPVSGDVNFGQAPLWDGTKWVANTSAADWHTLLIGGLGKGGRGYYALDVTSSDTSGDETTLAGNVVKWIFPNTSTASGHVTTDSKNIGYSYGRPIIAKTGAGWAILVTSGYNNGTATLSDGSDGTGGDGNGHLYVLNAKTGELIRTLDTYWTDANNNLQPAGTGSSPSGLAYIGAYVDDQTNHQATPTAIFGGDLKGNLWRFDVTDSNPSKWTVKRFAKFCVQHGCQSNTALTPQPITTEPEFAKITTNAGQKSFLFLGTGRYLGDTDVANQDLQSFYALTFNPTSPETDKYLDPNNTGATPSYPLFQRQLVAGSAPQTRTVSGTLVDVNGKVTTSTVDYSRYYGWWVDLAVKDSNGVVAQPGERSASLPLFVLGSIIFTSIIPNTDPCMPGGTSYVNMFEGASGGLPNGSSVTSQATIVTTTSGTTYDMASHPTLIQLGDGSISVLLATSKGVLLPINTTFDKPARRLSWREVPWSN